MIISWIYLCLAITMELAGTTCIKLSHGLTDIVPSIMMFVFYAASISLFAMALKKLNLGLAYAIWSGLGTAGIALIGILWLHESLSWIKVVGIALIVLGVVTLNLTNVTEEQLAQKQYD
ncbi:MAG: multidrug efflux SMR transporter [Moorea sp. SIO4A3]|nr:multidrug efflux SMR transporter [Moorena sp. SIO4A3]